MRVRKSTGPVIKRGPKKCDRATERANADKLRARMIELLTVKSMTVKEMGEALDCKPSTLRDYLHRMTNDGLVQSVLVKGYCGAPTAALYSLGKGEPNTACDRSSQKTLKVYPLNHVRDALVEALFGAARTNLA